MMAEFIVRVLPENGHFCTMPKFVSNDCLYSKYYAEFDDFKGAIEACLEKANTTHKESLATLLSLNFQSFKNVHILDV